MIGGTVPPASGEPLDDSVELRGPDHENRRVGVGAKEDEDDPLQHEGDPHQSEDSVGDVAAEVARDPTGRGQPVEESATASTVDHAVVEAAVEHPARVRPLLQPGTVVVLGEAVVGTEGPATAPALVRQVLVCATLVALWHHSVITPTGQK